MSNFDFLQAEWPTLYKSVKKIEERIYSEPLYSAFNSRLALEGQIYQIFEKEYIELPYNRELHNLMTNEEIKDIIPYHILNGLHIVRKTGNNAAHYGNKVSSKDALISLKYLYTFLKWLVHSYGKEEVQLPEQFVESYIPKIGSERRKQIELKKENERKQSEYEQKIAKLEAEKKRLKKEAEESEESLLKFKAEQEQAKAQLQKQKAKRVTKIASEYNEAETRKHLIDVDIKEAGWDQLAQGRELEYPVVGMPITPDNPKGNGFVDYVLWDDNGLPLALIEAKRTNKDSEVGKHQAFLYANCLEQMHGQRPIIFYTNGYETKIWNDTFYSTPRRVYGFYSKSELQWLIQQRSTRKDIRKANVNPDIAGRSYQMEAIQRVAEDFLTNSNNQLRGNKRSALLVMATGSGKTRTAAALVNVLFKHNWVKRVLFLADRNALVHQAKNNFNEHLPELSSINLSVEKENDTTRLVFSTYQSMIRKIDKNRNFYGVGHFDLIILDEAHRSIYSKYKSIFEYFDALLVGLTATPKKSIDHNTFNLFECSDEDPTFNYDLEQAVPVYLKPYKNIDVATKFIRDGIKYKDLSEVDKQKYEETFQDTATGLFPEEVTSGAINKWLFNKDTVNKVLDALMQKGLKIEGGDELGRTIIFAFNQKHADFIVKCFTKRYPEKPSGYIAVIHNQVSHAQSLIDSFCDQHNENLPQIAVSVDMMDTGIDAPRVLNLVFFKVVRSYAKFWQMIGRGTRLCPNVFGPNKDKEYFLVFDVCQNFEFFETNKDGLESDIIKPLSQQIFESRLQLSRLLSETGDADNIELSTNILDLLHKSIETLDRERFQVDMELRFVDEFKDREKWNNLSADDVHTIEEHLSGLPEPDKIPESARRFDLMMLKLQLIKLLLKGNEQKYLNNLIEIAEGLSKKFTIPQVKKSQKLIESMKDPAFYKQLSQKKIESVRQEIRELIKYLDTHAQEPVYTDLEDSELIITDEKDMPIRENNSIYKKRVERFIREHKSHLTISKLSTNNPITEEELKVLEEILFDGEERGSKEEFIKQYGEQPLGQFVRSIIGLDVEASNRAFLTFINSGNLTADQMKFIDTIIQYLTTNGIIDKSMLFESPFTDLNDQGIVGVFNDAETTKIINILDEINSNANVG